MWQIGMTPNITVDWKARDGETLTFPIGLGVNKMTITLQQITGSIRNRRSVFRGQA